jgi:hypothetical protein
VRFWAPEAPAPKHVHIPDPLKAIPDVVIVPRAAWRRSVRARRRTPRLKATLRVGNVLEDETEKLVHEADTLSALLAEQEVVRAD